MEDEVLKVENEGLANALKYGIEYYKNKLDLWNDNNFEFIGQYSSHKELNGFLKQEYDKKFK